MAITGISAILILMLLTLLISSMDSAVSGLSKLHLRVLIEKHGPRSRLLRIMGDDFNSFQMTLQVTIQVLLVLIAAVSTFLLCVQYSIAGLAASAIILLFTVIIFIQIVPRMIIRNRQEQFLLKLLPVLEPVYSLLNLLCVPALVFQRKMKEENDPEEEEEDTSEEEIQAYLGVGEEAGIFERSESDLIQSALEFSNTVVRDIMTSRNEMVTVEDIATMAQLRTVMVESRHSRIPITSQREGKIVGVVYVKTFLSMLENGFENKNIAPLISEVMFVPETKKVSVLLKEMQVKAEHMAMVVNEYGTVSGLVTIEDLLEEIVGDIRDEDEYCEVELLREAEGIYSASGSLEVKELSDTLDVSFAEYSASTVSGLVVESLGRIPSVGESISLEGVSFEVLDADNRRVHRFRIVDQSIGTE